VNPLDLRADEAALRSVDPLARARQQMEAAEAAETRAEEQRVAARREQHAEALQVQDMHDRIELARQGYLTREAQAVRAHAEAQRQGRIAELRDELGRLTGRGEWRVPQASEVDRLLEAHRAGRREWSTGAVMRQRQASLQAEIRRSQPPPTARACGGLAPVTDDRRWPDGPPPLSMPEAAPYLPRGDY
jgi:hypothetical protein